jgi:hypothetical protein
LSSLDLPDFHNGRWKMVSDPREISRRQINRFLWRLGTHSLEEIRQRKRVFDQVHDANSEYRRIRSLAVSVVLTHAVRVPHPLCPTVHPPTWHSVAPLNHSPDPHYDPAPAAPQPIDPPPFAPTKGAPNAGRVLNIARLRQRRAHIPDLEPDPIEQAPDLPGIDISRIVIDA